MYNVYKAHVCPEQIKFQQIPIKVKSYGVTVLFVMFSIHKS